jgi:hypothetical protein
MAGDIPGAVEECVLDALTSSVFLICLWREMPTDLRDQSVIERDNAPGTTVCDVVEYRGFWRSPRTAPFSRISLSPNMATSSLPSADAATAQLKMR